MRGVKTLLALELNLRDFLHMLIVLVGGGRLLDGLESFCVLAHGQENVGLSDVCLDYIVSDDFRHPKVNRELTKAGIDLDCFVDVLESIGKRHQLHVRSGTVVVAPRVRRITLDALGVVLDRTSKVSSLELGISFLASDMALLGVDVGLTSLISLQLFNFAQLGEDVGRSMFRQRLSIVLDCSSKITFLLAGGSCSSVGLGYEFVVCADLCERKRSAIRI